MVQHLKSLTPTSVREKVAWTLLTRRRCWPEASRLGRGGGSTGGPWPGVSSALRDVLGTVAPLRDQVAADMASGRLSPRADADIVINLLLGAYLAGGRWGSPRADWLDRTADLLAAVLRGPGE